MGYCSGTAVSYYPVPSIIGISAAGSNVRDYLIGGALGGNILRVLDFSTFYSMWPFLISYLRPCFLIRASLNSIVPIVGGN
jgi:hypothetical protein